MKRAALGCLILSNGQKPQRTVFTTSLQCSNRKRGHPEPGKVFFDQP